MRRLSDEQGATAVIVAILLVPLIGVGALILDGGMIYWEVRQLQNGADAAALAVAQDCAEGACGASLATASFFTNANANDGAADADVAIGLDGPSSVTVTASTRTDADADRLTYRFATILENTFGVAYNATFERAATAAWGRAGSGRTIPIALCERSWEYWTSNGTNLPSGPPAHILRFAGSSGATPNPHSDCMNPGTGDTYPGGFGFLTRDADCMAVSEEGDMFPGSAGNNPNDPVSSSCTPAAMYAMLKTVVDSGAEVLIPIFDYHVGSGTNASFHIIGYGGFVLTGWDINAGPGGSDRRYAMGASECGGGGASCLKGYYTRFVAIDGDLSATPGPGFGGDVVTLTR
jgi:Flp pilus assembly protein TadG